MIKRLLSILALISLLSSCSVFLALRDTPYDAYYISPGLSRVSIENKLGNPHALYSMSDKVVAAYTYNIYNPDPMRALMHAGLDLFTGGLWEFVGTPIEIWGTPTKVNLTVTYKDNIA